MKSVILLRHAKSDWEADYESDHDRPLNKRGRKAAAMMGHYLGSLGQLPDLVLSSTALRARETVSRAAEAGDWDCPVELTPELYEASPGSALELIRNRDDALGSLLLTGHEPTWSVLAGILVGGASLRMPTAAMARIDFSVESWGDVEPGNGTLIWQVTPKLLGRIGFEDSST
jgi:phosphohistidine phosphatase